MDREPDVSYNPEFVISAEQFIDLLNDAFKGVIVKHGESQKFRHGDIEISIMWASDQGKHVGPDSEKDSEYGYVFHKICHYISINWQVPIIVCPVYPQAVIELVVDSDVIDLRACLEPHWGDWLRAVPEGKIGIIRFRPQLGRGY